MVIATDGELYGHHQTFRELFLERLVQPRADDDPRGFDIVSLAEALAEPAGRPFRSVPIVERTSWSCHHGVLRWTAECPCVPDGRWKGPLRSAFERLAAGIDVVTAEVAAGLPGAPDIWAARDAYVDVVIGAEDGDDLRRAMARRRPGREPDRDLPVADGRAALAPRDVRERRLVLGRPDRGRRRPRSCAPRRTRRVWSTPRGRVLERRLVADLGLLTSPGFHLDGAEIYRRALAEVGQPAEDHGRGSAADRGPIVAASHPEPNDERRQDEHNPTRSRIRGPVRINDDP